MADQQQTLQTVPPTPPDQCLTVGTETDEEFLERQFRTSIAALERVGALAPGEFDQLVSTAVHTDEDRRTRTAHHEAIAKRALIAAQHNLLFEEDFNLWSGRRREDGRPIKPRFEEAYARVGSPHISCKRGALTGIVRSFIRLQDEFIGVLLEKAENATSATELLTVEREAVRYGFIDLESYVNERVAGWPSYPRSTGRFRGATRLRQFFEQRQFELPMPDELADAFSTEQLSYQVPVESSPNLGEASIVYHTEDENTTPLTRILTRITRLFR